MSTSHLVTQISEAVNAAIEEETAELRESLADVRAMMDYEDQGWRAIFGMAAGDKTEGLDLSEVQSISEKARTKVAAASLEKRATDLHGGYIFGAGMLIEGTERDKTASGRPPGLVTFFENTVNQENLFSDGAKKELQRARFTDGNVIVFCDTKTKEARQIPVSEIDGFITNPDHSSEIWAWRRTWTHHLDNGKTEEKQAWVYTNRFKGARKKSISDGTKEVPVLQGVTAVDLRANRQVGWALGVPDATAGMHWTAAYGETLRYGQIVSESLAKIIYKVVSKTQKTANTVGVKMRNAGAGGVAAVGEGQDIQLVNSSQRSFDFTAARPLAAMAASAWNVTNPDLLNDSSASGSSYGSLNALTRGNLNAMLGMQQDWTQFYQDVFDVMGFGRVPIHWPPLEKPDLYREMQIAALAWNSGNFHAEEIRPRMAEIASITLEKDKAPEGVLLPNNRESWERADIDEPTGGTGTTTSAASPDQGRSSGDGGAGSTINSDTRTDKVSEMLQQMQQDAFLDRLEELVGRLEEAKR